MDGTLETTEALPRVQQELGLQQVSPLALRVQGLATPRSQDTPRNLTILIQAIQAAQSLTVATQRDPNLPLDIQLEQIPFLEVRGLAQDTLLGLSPRRDIRLGHNRALGTLETRDLLQDTHLALSPCQDIQEVLGRSEATRAIQAAQAFPLGMGTEDILQQAIPREATPQGDTPPGSPPPAMQRGDSPAIPQEGSRCPRGRSRRRRR